MLAQIGRLGGRVTRSAWSPSRGSAAQLLQLAMRPLLLAASLVITSIVVVALAATALGYDLFVITGGSMAPSVPAGSLVIAERVPPTSLAAGDVITFRRSSAPDSPVTHRVIRVTEGETGLEIWTKGDANNTADPEPLTDDNPISSVRVTLPFAGYLLSFMRTTLGQLILVVAPVVLVLGTKLVHRSTHEGAPAIARAVPSPLPTTSPPPSSASGGTGATRPGLSLPSLRLPMRVPIRGIGAQISARASHLWSRVRTADASTTTETVVPRATRVRAVATEPDSATRDLVAAIGRGVEPVEALARELDGRMSAFEVAMARSLRPLTEYADQLESNLERLVRRLNADGTVLDGPLARQIDAERTRLVEVRRAIEKAKGPLRETLHRETLALDAMLSPFDRELESVEALVRQQRRHLVKVLAGLESDQFSAALSLMRRRSGELRVLAELGETNPEEVRRTLTARDAASNEPGDLDVVESQYLELALSVLTAGAEDSGDPTASRTSAA